ncbi:MAG: type II secretion system minor pseudopilin GspJ [Pseudomonadota bacterium]|nr:type II secretion system minor pseudopilin GspJ [Pseudomonadota bacterium]
MSQNHKLDLLTSGFTLLELLVALAIFAVMAMLSYSGFNSILTTYEHTQRYTERLSQLQQTVTYLRHDIEQYLDRPIRDQYGDRQPAIQGFADQFEFTRAGWRNPAQQPRSQLQRLHYYFEDQQLWRAYWPVLDRAQDTTPLKIALVDSVETLQLRFLDIHLTWHDQWPPLEQSESTQVLKLTAIEVNLSIQDWGHFTWLFQLPVASL